MFAIVTFERIIHYPLDQRSIKQMHLKERPVVNVWTLLDTSYETVYESHRSDNDYNYDHNDHYLLLIIAGSF